MVPWFLAPISTVVDRVPKSFSVFIFLKKKL